MTLPIWRLTPRQGPDAIDAGDSQKIGNDVADSWPSDGSRGRESATCLLNG